MKKLKNKSILLVIIFFITNNIVGMEKEEELEPVIETNALEAINTVNNLRTLLTPFLDKETLLIELMQIAVETKKPTGFVYDGKILATFYAPDTVLLGTGKDTQSFKMPVLLNFIDLLKEEREKEKKKAQERLKKKAKKPCVSCTIS